MSLFIDTKNIPNQITITNKNSLKVISLFSGCGGMDLGFIGNFNSLGNFYPKQPFEIILPMIFLRKLAKLISIILIIILFAKIYPQLMMVIYQKQILLLVDFPVKILA